ncbi:MAG TPA: hypothetical protein VG708_03395 [Mycobacteriales bacterium]|nr:hypothetical protein [Mycobacteriales bacterium]
MRLVSLTGLLGFLAVLGIGGYDAVAVMPARMSAADDAQDAAYAASQTWRTTGNYSAAYQAAAASIAGDPETIAGGITFDPDGTAHLVLHRRVDAILIGHLGPLRDLTTATEHGDANALP